MSHLITRHVNPNDLYEVTTSLGEGSYGAVWRGRDRKTSKDVAIKIVAVEDGDETDLIKEIEILEKCKDDFVVNFYGAYEYEAAIWMVMELAEAGSVNDVMLICDLALEEGLIKIVIASALCGLEYLHKNRMIHRDIKAGNILLTKTGQAKLADFGVSARLESMQSKRHTVIGTPFWMAPEVIQESQYDCKADIWSLGITLIELADREPPYSNIHPMRAIFMIPSRPPPTFLNESAWSSDMVSFLKRCLVKNPEERASAVELMSHPFVKNEVQKLLAGKPRGFSSDLLELVNSCLGEIAQFREEEAARANSGVAHEGKTTLVQTRGGKDNTAVLKTTLVMNSSNAGGGGGGAGRGNQSGTMVIDGGGGGGGTLKIDAMAGATLVKSTPGTAHVQPDFMAYFDVGENGQDNNSLALGKSESEVLSKGMAKLNKQFRQDLVELRKAYEKRKNALFSAAGVPTASVPSSSSSMPGASVKG